MARCPVPGPIHPHCASHQMANCNSACVPRPVSPLPQAKLGAGVVSAKLDHRLGGKDRITHTHTHPHPAPRGSLRPTPACRSPLGASPWPVSIQVVTWAFRDARSRHPKARSASGGGVAGPPPPTPPRPQSPPSSRVIVRTQAIVPARLCPRHVASTQE